jgi:hypothetical protein
LIENKRLLDASKVLKLDDEKYQDMKKNISEGEFEG